ncbi:MAG: hypothetical protein OHK93_002774 [Ramalina farinacea]|uniref:Expansin-like EG45 domain-containing protein n=1 Tax=Ramalina farinacea TaxID=258253 RepID=A0AA43TZ46_9LECA|nr:hypothetical protein [Ramalina farinacea]
MRTQTLLAVLATTFSLCAASTEYGQCGGKEYSDYSQCTPSGTDDSGSACEADTGDTDPKSGPGSGPSNPTPPTPPTTSEAAAAASTAPSTTAPTTSTPPSIGGGGTVNSGACTAFSASSKKGYATTTHYYDGQEGACGCGTNGALSPWQATPDSSSTLFTAAGSQSLFGGSGSWCGSGCGTCYKLTNANYIAASGQGDCTGAGDSITVMITNLCPADGNQQWCGGQGGSGNQYGFGAHFDIMSQGGPKGWNNPVVAYEQVPCPGTFTTDYATCQCANGATSRVRRGLLGNEDMGY